MKYPYSSIAVGRILFLVPRYNDWAFLAFASNVNTVRFVGFVHDFVNPINERFRANGWRHSGTAMKKKINKIHENQRNGKMIIRKIIQFWLLLLLLTSIIATYTTQENETREKFKV